MYLLDFQADSIAVSQIKFMKQIAGDALSSYTHYYL